MQYNYNGDPNKNELELSSFFSTLSEHKYSLMTISMIFVSISILYILYKPNVYISQSILIPKEQAGQSPISGGAAAMAAMTGINISTNSGLDISSLFKNLLNDYAFNKPLIEKHKLYEMISPEQIEKNLVFVAQKREVYDFFKNFIDDKKEKKFEEVLFDTFKKLKKILNVYTDKKTGAITLIAKFEDRFVTKEIINIYLKEMSEYIKRLDLKEIDEQVIYYERELQRAKNLDLKANINELLSTLVKKKVLSQAGEFYMVKQLTKPQVAYVKDKAGPDRVLIIVVTFITSIIFGIFLIFFKELLKNPKEQERKSEISF